jgi:uncharacterized protein YgiM (DUF1202 family)
MKKTKLMIVSFVFLLGFVAGSFMPFKSISAQSNVILASVEWVTSQINPLKSRVDKLEAEVQALRQALADTNLDIPTTPSKVYVKSMVATIHSGALTSYRIVSQKPIGTELKVIDQYDSKEGRWYRVEYSSGNYGWIQQGDISFSSVAKPTTVVVTKTTYLYSGASTTYRKVATLSAGQSYKFITAFRNNSGEIWYNIELKSGTRGWMQATYGEVK